MKVIYSSDMANQFWLIGPLTPHMDRRSLPSNGDVLRRLFFLQKLANYRFSEACCEVRAELEHIWQQFQLDISTKSHLYHQEVRLLLNEYNCIRNNRHRFTISFKNRSDSFAEKLTAMFDISTSNAVESIKSKRLQRFLIFECMFAISTLCTIG
jgi:hypothetical protein